MRIFHQSDVNMMTRFLGIAIVLGLCGCANEAALRMGPKPTAIGSLYQLGVICDQDDWDGAIGDSIRFFYGSAFPILPQPEPYFDIKHFTPEELEAEPLRKELKAYVIIASTDSDGPTTKLLSDIVGESAVKEAAYNEGIQNRIAKDQWASGQTLIYLYAQNKSILESGIPKSFSVVSKRIEEHYDNQLDATTYLGRENPKLQTILSEEVGVKLRIPSEYFLATAKDGVAWIRKETDNTSNNILIQRLPYTDPKQLTKDSLIHYRNRMTQGLVETDIEGAFMRVNDKDLPVFVKQVDLSGSYAVEARGIWEMVGDFMGGAFTLYAILDEAKGEIVLVDTFLFAPSERKRNFMLQLQHIIKSLEI